MRLEKGRNRFTQVFVRDKPPADSHQKANSTHHNLPSIRCDKVAAVVKKRMAKFERRANFRQAAARMTLLIIAPLQKSEVDAKLALVPFKPKDARQTRCLTEDVPPFDMLISKEFRLFAALGMFP